MAFPRNPEHFWPLLWGGAALALVAALVLEHQYGRSTAGEGPRAPARVAEAKLLPPFRVAEVQADAETITRPLFVPGRRPSPPATVDAGTMKRGQFLLQGTVLVDSVHIAFLKEVGSGTVHRVAKGEEIKGMKLAEVSAERVVLKVGEDAETLPLVVAKTAGAPPAAAAAAERGPFAGAEAPAKASEAAAAPAAPPAAAVAAPAEAATAAARRTPVPRARPTPEEIAARRANRPTRPSRTPSAPAPGAQPQN
ncbi:MAG TPA: hypothetical protein VFX72_06490 [Usitatibacteraceae bacterium]|nr:hypothetical protein [Usitatibacteraceae bacterium]